MVAVAASVWAHVHWATVGSWMWNLYRNGPQLTSWGFWAGMADEEVCARLSYGSQARDWMDDGMGPAARCQALILRSFASFSVVVHSAMYMFLVYTALKMVLMRAERWHMAKLLAREFKALLDQDPKYVSTQDGKIHL